jgi:hypothetical protein
MSIQEHIQGVDAQASRPPREGVIAELYVSSSFASMQLRKDDGDVDNINLWSDATAADPQDRLERTMWLSMCREALIHKKRVRVHLRSDVIAANNITLIG